MRKVLIISTVSRQFYLFEKVNIKALRKLGYEVHGAANYSDRNERLSEVDIVEHEVSLQRNPFSLKNIVAYFQLKKIIKKEDYEIIHCHSPVGGVVGRLAAKHSKTPTIIYTAHGFHFYKGAKFLNWMLYYPIEYFMSKRTDILITINSEDYQRACLKFKSAKCKLVNGIGLDVDKFQPNDPIERQELRKKYGYANNDFILISVGELNKNKNQISLIKSLEILINKISTVKLLLVGTGKEEKNLIKYVEERKLEKFVKFLGSREDIKELLSISDVALSASKREGLPVSILEAMSMGLPLVVNDCRGNRDLIKNNINGFLVKNSCPKEFSKNLNKLYTNKLLSEKFSKNNINLVKNYSSDKIFEEVIKIYKDQ